HAPVGQVQDANLALADEGQRLAQVAEIELRPLAARAGQRERVRVELVVADPHVRGRSLGNAREQAVDEVPGIAGIRAEVTDAEDVLVHCGARAGGRQAALRYHADVTGGWAEPAY